MSEKAMMMAMVEARGVSCSFAVGRGLFAGKRKEAVR